MIQLQVLNRLIQSGDFSIITLNNLDNSYFSDYQKEFNFIVNHYNDYGTVPDKETFLSEFNNFDFIQVNETNKYLVDELYKEKQVRQLATSFNKIKDSLRDGKLNEALNIFNATHEALGKSAHIDAVDILHDTARYDDYIQKSLNFDNFFIKTGFKELDDIIGGWDKSEEVATIVARPNVGKSYILFKIALEAAKQGLTVGLYSGEMSEKKVGFRIDTLFGNLSNTKITRGNRQIQNEYKKLLEDLTEVKGKLLVLTPSMIGSLADINTLRGFVEKEKLDILCIDQHSLLEDAKNSRDPVTRAANISMAIKQLQVLEKIPIISVSQANREIPEDGKITLENIAQTDRIGQDSTIVIGLVQENGVLSMLILKNRDGEKGGTLRYAVDFDKGLFEFVPNEKDGVESTDYEALNNKYASDYDNGVDAF